MATNKNTTTFWKFLSEQKIEIPIIQRDYAQGRVGKEKLREKFLKDLKEALDEENKVLKLDFVYGSIESDKLNPLDGQQRLTTLWLLHWYIAYKAGKLAENKDVFKRFSYETRVSSREFCNKLSEFTEPQPDDKNIVEHITNQTWFFSAWKQDPTIQAMLTMLGGTKIPDSKTKADITDGIAELFNDSNFNDYWEKLTETNGKICPIVFYYMPLNELKMSDDLYIKMNARGKQLTSFENFKADLVGYIKEKKENNEWNDFERKLDNDWTDIFWKFRSSENKIDEIYFAFLNRYFLNALILKNKDEETAEKIEENNGFKYLYGKKGDDTNILYNSFDVYKDIIDEPLLQQLAQTLDNYYKIKEFSLCFPEWVEKTKFFFIPKYDNGGITILTRRQRVVFHAICCYFEQGEYDKVSFERWMRVVWNIVENSDSESNMVGAIKFIDQLKQVSHDIYNHLKDREIKDADFASEQMKEEREKAKQIVNGDTSEQKIIEAENTAFFKGAIRFMFTKEDGTYDWNLFDDRLEKAKRYFNKNGVTDGYKKDALLLRVLISKFTEWNNFTKINYDNNISTWKDDFLTSKKQIQPVCELFAEKDVPNIDHLATFSSTLKEDQIKLFHEDLVRTPLLSKIEPGCTFHWWNYGDKYSLYPYNTKSQRKIYVLADKRNEILSKLMDKGIIECNQKIKDVPYFWGWEIEFKHKNGNKYHEYQWWDNLKKWNDTTKQYEEVKGVTLETLEDYLKRI